MDSFKKMVTLVEAAKIEADKFYITENMQAGKRYFSLLMEISRQCKSAREDLSEERKRIRKERKNQQ